MKISSILFMSFLLLVGANNSSAQTTTSESGINFYHGSFQEAKALAKKENKIIFVDAFTTWCGPCKIMAKRVFTDEGVGTFYNSNFINMKIDMESSEGLNFAKSYEVSGYPTFLYINGNGDLVHKEMGMVDAAAFIIFGKSALKHKK